MPTQIVFGSGQSVLVMPDVAAVASDIENTGIGHLLLRYELVDRQGLGTGKDILVNWGSIAYIQDAPLDSRASFGAFEQ